MTEIIQSLWDQIRADLRVRTLPQLETACRDLVDGSLGPLTDTQIEDLESIKRSLAKLSKRIDGEPIDWSDYGEAAHALRGPLNSTLGFSRLMLKGVDGPINAAQQGALETIYTNSRQQLALFKHLLDASMLTQGDIEYCMVPVQAQVTLEELVTAARALANSRGFVLVTEPPPLATDAEMVCDQERFKQALSALLAVAVTFMRGSQLTLRAQIHGRALLIEFENEGCHLPTALMDNLSFLLTPKADRSFPYDAHLWLGLANRFTSGMGGQLKVRQTDKTCTFTLTMPVV